MPNAIDLQHTTTAATEDLTALRRHLHQHPEIGFQEFETSKFIRSTLEESGFDVQGPIAGTGLYVDIPGNGPGPHIAYRADIDALPTQDAKRVAYASKHPGAAHLCGHDAHTSIAIGVARTMKAHADAFPGLVRVFFQPNEEGYPSGAPRMIDGGVLNGLEAAYAIHVDPTLPVGQYGLTRSAVTASAVRFMITVRSATTGHSARPHEAVDTIWLATQLAQTYYQLVGRHTDPRDSTILTICRFQAGTALNVIPSEAEFGGTLRSTSIETSQVVCEHMRTAAEHLGKQFGATIDVMFDDGLPPVINDPRLVDQAADVIEAQHNPDAVFWLPRPSMGAEDFAHYLQHIPGMLLRVGTSSGPGTSYPLHDAHFDIDESAMPLAVQTVAGILLKHLHHSPLSEG